MSDKIFAPGENSELTPDERATFDAIIEMRRGMQQAYEALNATGYFYRNRQAADIVIALIGDELISLARPPAG